MSDYEATAYLSLEKLKVSIYHSFCNWCIGKTHAWVPDLLGENQEGAYSKNEVQQGLVGAKRQRGQACQGKAIWGSWKSKDEGRSIRRIWKEQVRGWGKHIPNVL